MLTCQALNELVTDHLEGRLSLSEELSFQFHLGLCAHCRAYLKQMRGIIRSLGSLAAAQPLPAPSAAVQEELIARFRNFQRSKKKL